MKIAWMWMMIGSALAVAITAGWLDWRSRKIPNWLTLPAALCGISFNIMVFGWPGLKSSLEGLGLGLLLLLPFVLVRGIGAGDWKLMGALGAFLGPQSLLLVLWGAVMIAGLMGLVQVIRRKAIKQTFYNIAIILQTLVTFGTRGVRDSGQKISLDNPGLMAVPFGVAAALSMIVFVCWLSAVTLRV